MTLAAPTQDPQPAGYIFATDPHPAAEPVTADHLDAMRIAGNFAGLAAALQRLAGDDAQAQQEAQPVPTPPPAASVAPEPDTAALEPQPHAETIPQAAETAQTRAQAAPSFPAPSRETLRTVVHRLDDAAAVLAGVCPHTRRQRNVAASMSMQGPAPDLQAANSAVVKVQRLLEQDAIFSEICDPSALHVERDSLLRIQEQRKAARLPAADPGIVKDRRFSAAVDLRAAAALLRARGLQVPDGIPEPGAAAHTAGQYTQRPPVVSRLIAGPSPEELAELDRGADLRTVAVIACGASPGKRARLQQRRSADVCQPSMKNSPAFRAEGEALDADERAIGAALATLVQSMPAWDAECEAREAAHVRERRAQESRYRAQAGAGARLPRAFEFDVSTRAFAMLSPDQIRAAFEWAATREGFAPPVLAPLAPAGAGKFAYETEAENAFARIALARMV